MQIVSRREAILAGLVRYFTGEPCGRGHVSERNTTDRQCVKCNNEKQKRRYDADPESARARAISDYQNNRDRNIKRMADYRAANPSIMKTTEKAWRLANHEKRNALHHTTRARKKAAKGTWGAPDIIRIREMQRDRCALCKKPLRGKGHADHIKPLARGGSNWPRNIQLLCVRCNHRKKDKDPLCFAREVGLLL